MDDRKREAVGRIQAVSRRLADGTLVELIYQRREGATAFAVYRDGQVSTCREIMDDRGVRLVPIPFSNSLIRHGAVLLPDEPEPCGTTEDLLGALQAYLFRYVDLSEGFQRIVGYYILLSWVYDAFDELPYLRLRGDFGSGKTRGLLVIGSVCYKGFFASGASTVSPIFHTLDRFRGTLIFDEADFRFSDEKAELVKIFNNGKSLGVPVVEYLDEKAELVKIFNNGNAKGFPVLRTVVTQKREFNPTAFHVFGPKIVAMRRSFDDPALESRFLTEEMGQRRLRPEISISMPGDMKAEAESLRNKLLMYRFQTLDRIRVDGTHMDPSLSPRLNQILLPLLSLVNDQQGRDEIRNTARTLECALKADRSATPEAGVLEVLAELFAEGFRVNVPLSEVTAAMIDRYGQEYERTITNRYVGGLIRNRLHLATYKSHGVYVIPATEAPKVEQLQIRYGLVEKVA